MNRPDQKPTPGVAQWLALNPATLALLATILLVTAATELWSPLVPEFIKALRDKVVAGDKYLLLIVGAYGCYRDLLEAVNYFLGGWLAGHLDTRRALVIFNLLPLVGLAILGATPTWIGVFIAIPFVFVWDSIAGPAVITVVGLSVPPERRTMAFSLQAIFRRISRIVANSLAALLVWHFGRVSGVQAAVWLALILLLVAAVIQFRFQSITSRDRQSVLRNPIRLLRQFDPELRKLLLADIGARWAEGIARELVVLYCIPILATNRDDGAALYASVLLTTQWVTSLLSYAVVGPLASREGFAKKPYIGMTFVFFSIFPISLVLLGSTLGFFGLALAFVMGGLREFGEPARKAMIADLVAADVRTQSIGLYWSARSIAVTPAPLFGAVLWMLGDHLSPAHGPWFAFGAAGVIGIVSALVFMANFGKSIAKS